MFRQETLDPTGIGPATSAVRRQRSPWLSYEPVFFKHFLQVTFFFLFVASGPFLTENSGIERPQTVCQYPDE